MWFNLTLTSYVFPIGHSFKHVRFYIKLMVLNTVIFQFAEKTEIQWVL